MTSIKEKGSTSTYNDGSDIDLSQAKSTDVACDAIPLSNILSKCKKEEDIADDEQPLYIDWELDLIKCGWCHHFKGSTEPRVVNQQVFSEVIQTYPQIWFHAKVCMIESLKYYMGMKCWCNNTKINVGAELEGGKVH